MEGGLSGIRSNSRIKGLDTNYILTRIRADQIGQSKITGYARVGIVTLWDETETGEDKEEKIGDTCIFLL